MNEIQIKFIKEVTARETVFFLEDQNGVAFCESLFFKTDSGEAVPVLCFWSTRELVEAARVESWSHYTVNEMCLSTFIEDWLVQLYNDSLIAGINFNKNLEGTECDPLDLISDLVSELKRQRRDLEFEHFKGIADIEKQIKSLS